MGNSEDPRFRPPKFDLEAVSERRQSVPPASHADAVPVEHFEEADVDEDIFIEEEEPFADDPVAAQAVAHLESPPATGTTWGQGIAVLVITLAAFYATGMFHQKRSDMLLLAGVLLFHEAGHFVGMRLFGYRNVKMFFIPFFGAAVSGKKTNVPGWQEAIVLLLGPLPGIVLGCGLAGATFFSAAPLLRTLAQNLLFINAFNLLPIMPFDGGRLFNLLLFARNRYIEWVFRVVTGLLLAAFGFYFHAWVLAALGVFMVLGTGYCFRISTMAMRLRQQPGAIVAATDDVDTVSRTASVPLVAEVRRTFPTLKNPRALANTARQVWERMHWHHPGWLSTLIFLGVYVGALLAAPVAFVAMMLRPQTAIEEVVLADGTKGRREVTRFAGQIVVSNELSPQLLYHGKHVEYSRPGQQLVAEGEWKDGFEHGEWMLYGDIPNSPLLVKFERGQMTEWRWEENGRRHVISGDQINPLLIQLLDQHRARGPHGPHSGSVEGGIPAWTGTLSWEILKAEARAEQAPLPAVPNPIEDVEQPAGVHEDPSSTELQPQ